MNPANRISNISVIVVNYGTATLAIEAVSSVLGKHHGGRQVDVHLVDNASPENDAALIEAAHADLGWGDRVTIYPETINHGFGRGNNLVLRRLGERATPPDAVLLLNPDALLANETIDIMASAMEAVPDAGFAGPGVAKPDNTSVTAAFRFPSAAGEFAQSLNFGPVSRALRRWQVPLPADHPAGAVDWVTGAACLARFDALREIGFFDPAFFLYFEEVDLMRQGARLGWSCLYVPDARIVHIEGAATGVKSHHKVVRRDPPYLYQSWRHYFEKNHGRAGAVFAGAARMAGSAGHHAIARLRGKNVQVPSFFFRDFWTYSLRPLLRSQDNRPVETDRS